MRFSVDRSRPLPADVTATIKYRNMVGQRYIALERGEKLSADLLAEDAEIPLDRTSPALDLTDLFNGFKPLFQALSPKDVNELSGEIVQVLQGEGGTVDSLLAHTGSLTTTLADRDQVIGQVIDEPQLGAGATSTARATHCPLWSRTLQQLVSGLAGDRAAIGDAIAGHRRPDRRHRRPARPGPPPAQGQHLRPRHACRRTWSPAARSSSSS